MFEHFETLSIRRDGPVDWLTLDRPDVLNSINTQMVTELREYFGSLSETLATRIVVISGAGRAFCAGLDIEAAAVMNSKDGTAPAGGGWGFQGYLAEVYAMMRRVPQPIISLVQGAACGGGFALALASDSRVRSGSFRHSW